MSSEHLISTHLAGEIKFLGDLPSGEYLPEPVAAPDWLRIARHLSVVVPRHASGFEIVP